MEFEKKILNFLIGKEFSNALEIKICDREKNIISRIELLKNITKNKKIIHLGCCDHLELIESKIKSNIWLHGILMKTSKECLGVDINSEGIDYLKEKLNIADIICANLVNEKIDLIMNGEWDYLICGEIIEHIDNPVDFLKSIHENYSSSIKKIVITVPNAFSLTNHKYLMKQKEIINSDHRYWFTPFTLGKTLTMAGYNIESFYFAQELNKGISLKAKLKVLPFLRQVIRSKKLRTIPAFRDILIMIAEF